MNTRCTKEPRKQPNRTAQHDTTTGCPRRAQCAIQGETVGAQPGSETLLLHSLYSQVVKYSQDDSKSHVDDA